MSDTDAIMALADEWYAHGQMSHSGIDKKYAALRAAVEQLCAQLAEAKQDRDVAEVDAHELRGKLERAEQENLQRGNVIGRITAHLLGNKNNVSDEDVVIAAAEAGRALQGARLRAERERDAAIALLKEARVYVVEVDMDELEPFDLLARIDALLEKK